jgi:two-component system CheB/CheR fusion protein
MEVLKTAAKLEQEIEELRQQLEEANDTIEAIRTGQVDALIVKDKKGHQLYTLKSADQTYRVFIEKMIEGAVTLNEKGIILYSNSRFASMMKLPLSKIIGSYFETFVPNEYRESFDNLLNNGWKAESKGEIYLATNNDELIPFLISLTTLELDDGSALSLIITDLSIQKDIEKELKEKNEQLQSAQIFTSQLNNQLDWKVKERTKELLTSREHFKFLADTIPVIVWTAQPNGDFDYFNKRWYEYTGLTFEKSKGTGWQSVVHQDDLPASLIAWNHSIKTGESFKIEDRKRCVDDGTYHWHLAHALPFKDTDGKIIAWFGVCTDIEDQKRAMEKKDEFISMASHELKTPVTSLKAFTQIMMMTFEGEGNSMASSMLNKMDKQINKLTGLISDLLDASKANLGQLKFENEDFDFNELVKEIVDEVQRTSTTHKIELALAKTQTISGDRNRIGQVIMNLLSNAIKYSPQADNIIIRTDTKDQIKLCVEDFGIGIPVSQQPKLFTRFFRATNDRTNTYPGLGLGLYISNEIIKRHSGTIDFKSEEDKGSTFCFSLPLKSGQ